MARSGLGAFGKMKWQYQVLIVVGVCGLLLAGAWYQFLSPMQEQIVAKEKELSDLNLQVAKSQAQKKMFEQFKAETVELGKKLDDLKKELPLEKETSQILESVKKEAQDAGVRVLRLNVRSTIVHDVYTEWPWDMEIIGTYNNVGAFLDRIRLLPRIVSVAGLKVSSRAPEGEKSFTESVGTTFTATTYIYHEEPIETTAPAAKPANAK